MAETSPSLQDTKYKKKTTINKLVDKTITPAPNLAEKKKIQEKEVVKKSNETKGTDSKSKDKKVDDNRFRFRDIGTGKNFQRWRRKRKKKKLKNEITNTTAGQKKAMKKDVVYTQKFVDNAKANNQKLADRAVDVEPKDSKIRAGASSYHVTEGGTYPSYANKPVYGQAGSTELKTTVGNKQARDSYRKAYKKARAEYMAKGDAKGSSHKHTFEWDGRKYSVESKEEQKARLAKKKEKK